MQNLWSLWRRRATLWSLPFSTYCSPFTALDRSRFILTFSSQRSSRLVSCCATRASDSKAVAHLPRSLSYSVKIFAPAPVTLTFYCTTIQVTYKGDGSGLCNERNLATLDVPRPLRGFNQVRRACMMHFSRRLLNLTNATLAIAYGRRI